MVKKHVHRPGGAKPEAAVVALVVLTSSSLRLCSFCSSMRFWRSASSCRLCSSFSRCCCSSCCRRRASERSLLANCSLRKSRRSVDSPGRFRMELWTGKDMERPHVMRAIATVGPGGGGRRTGFAPVSRRSFHTYVISLPKGI